MSGFYLSLNQGWTYFKNKYGTSIAKGKFNDFLLLNSDNKFLDTVEEDAKFTLQSEEVISKTLSIEKEVKPKEIIDKPIDVPKAIIKYIGNKSWPRNADISANSIVHSNYKCSFNNNHKSFISNKTKKPYMEPHHLIPLSQQDKFHFSLDVEANIVSLCSNCHNCVHYGTNEEKREILTKLFNFRKNRLKKCGIEITLEELLKIYNIPLDIKIILN